jgi:anti-sigma regulatory factor (Ser/Thr protein kinase)
MAYSREVCAVSLGSVESAKPEEPQMRWCSAVVSRELEAPSRLRAMTAAALEVWDLLELAEAAELCVSELVTNAVRHGTGSAIGFALAITDRLIVEVFDYGPGTPVSKPVGEEFEGGRGLWLVEAIAEDWGWERLHHEWKRVWCTFTIPGACRKAEGPERSADRSGPEHAAGKVSCPP